MRPIYLDSHKISEIYKNNLKPEIIVAHALVLTVLPFVNSKNLGDDDQQIL